MHKPGNVIRLLKALAIEEHGATAVEYAVMLGLVLLSVISAIAAVGAQTGGMWSGIVSSLKAVGFISGP